MPCQTCIYNHLKQPCQIKAKGKNIIIGKEKQPGICSFYIRNPYQDIPVTLQNERHGVSTAPARKV